MTPELRFLAGPLERGAMVGNHCQGAVAALPRGIGGTPQVLEAENVKNSDLESCLILRGILTEWS